MTDSRFDPDENPPPPERKPFRAPGRFDPVTPEEVEAWNDAFAREHRLGKYRQKRQPPPPEPRDRGEGVFGTEATDADPEQAT